MLKKFKDESIEIPVIMGGRLNENMEGSELPVDVSEQIAALGINVDNNAETMISYIQDVLQLTA